MFIPYSETSAFDVENYFYDFWLVTGDLLGASSGFNKNSFSYVSSVYRRFSSLR